MDSINKNQPEENHENLSSQDAAEKIKDLVKQAPTCFFCTSISTGASEGVRPMSVQKVDDNGCLWFLSAKDSHKNQEIAASSSVKLFFQGSAHSDFLQLSGKATISYDKEKVKELWEPVLKTWFTEGENDERLSVIQVTPSGGYYWDTKHNRAVAGVKMVIGAITGITLDDSVEGELKP